MEFAKHWPELKYIRHRWWPYNLGCTKPDEFISYMKYGLFGPEDPVEYRLHVFDGRVIVFYDTQ
jgi:hypothetical protein